MNNSILQFTPKGSYYDTAEEQFKAYQEQVDELFRRDRSLFALISILPGTDYAKGVFAHKLLSNPCKEQYVNYNNLLPFEEKMSPQRWASWQALIEERVIAWNLKRMSPARALKNLLMLTGKGYKRVNNARTRRVILDYVFDRTDESLENLVLHYKQKIAKLLKHAIGEKKLYYIVKNEFFTKQMTRLLNPPMRMKVLRFIYNLDVQDDQFGVMYPKLKKYLALREWAADGDADRFLEGIEGFPFEVALGFRNTYKLDVGLDELHRACSKTKAQKIQSKKASERRGVEVDINYDKHDIYDLYKLFYACAFDEGKAVEEKRSELEKIKASITKQSKKKLDFDLGEVSILLDASGSMRGSDARPMHPFITSLTLMNRLPKVKEIAVTGGYFMQYGEEKSDVVLAPGGATNLCESFFKLKSGETLIVFSDGYENQVKGFFEKAVKASEDKFENILHVNPVYAADAKGARRVISDVEPIMIDNSNYFKTALILTKIDADPRFVKKLLYGDYKKQIERRVT